MEITRRTDGAAVVPRDAMAALQRFEDFMLDQLEAVGLPTDGVVADLDERQQLLDVLGSALRALPEADRGRALYISKMIIVAAVGAFDAALNYLWDETISALRQRVVRYDLGYFFDIAVKSSDLRKYFSTEADLQRVQDADLLSACREIGLLSNEGYMQLDLIRYMRNHASAAHPNEVQLTGLQLATWLQTCILQVINLPEDQVTTNTGHLLANIKAYRLDEASVGRTASFFEALPVERANTLAAGFFGLYTDGKRTPIVADNVRQLWPKLWDRVTEDARYNFGLRYGQYESVADTDRATAARELLDLVDGTGYLPDGIRAVEIKSAIEALMVAHNGFDNFLNEPEPAKRLESLVGPDGQVPERAEQEYVRALVKLFVGNGYGVSHSAEPSYRHMLGNFDPKQAGIAVRAFTDLSVSSVIGSASGKRQWAQLLEVLEPKLTRPADRELYDAVIAFTGPPNMLYADATIGRLLRTRRVVRRRRTQA